MAEDDTSSPAPRQRGAPPLSFENHLEPAPGGAVPLTALGHPGAQRAAQQRGDRLAHPRLDGDRVTDRTAEAPNHEPAGPARLDLDLSPETPEQRPRALRHRAWAYRSKGAGQAAARCPEQPRHLGGALFQAQRLEQRHQ